MAQKREPKGPQLQVHVNGFRPKLLRAYDDPVWSDGRRRWLARVPWPNCPRGLKVSGLHARGIFFQDR